MLTGCATYRIAGAITARHVAAHLVEHDIEICKDALHQAQKLQGFITSQTYTDGVQNPGERWQLKRMLGDLLALFIVGDTVLAANVRDLYLVLMPEIETTFPYEKVRDVRYMVDAFIEVAERGLRDADKKPDSS